MTDKQFTIAASFIMLAFFILGSVLVRPLLPPDETRYMTVAWEMLVRHDFILPTLNYEPYHHKPPLLFWLINAVWAIGGIGETPVRILMGAICALFLTLAYKLYVRVFPNIANSALLLVLASPVFIAYGTHIMFDTLMGVFVLAALICIVDLSKSPKSWRLWGLLACAIAGGGLAKGPAVLLHILPLALLMPIWVARDIRPNMTRWYCSLLASVTVGIAGALAWAIPAALRGGPEYARMIFYGQSTGRMVQAFDHARPFYWYIPIIVAFCLLPLLMPSLWRGIVGVKQTGLWWPNARQAMRFFLCWSLPIVIAFSLISGKQVHYLMPVIPALMGMIAIVISQYDNAFIQTRRLVVASLLVLASVLFFGADKLKNYDLKPLAAAYKQYVHQGPVAVDQKYDGEYGYLLGLTGSVTIVHEHDMARWLAQHPDGVVVHRRSTNDPDISQQNLGTVFAQKFRNNQTISLLVQP